MRPGEMKGLGDLRFGGFLAHRAQGGSGDFDLFAGAVFESDADSPQIGELALLGFVVGVGYVVSDQGAFTGNLTSSCHIRTFFDLNVDFLGIRGCLLRRQCPNLKKVLRFYRIVT